MSLAANLGSQINYVPINANAPYINDTPYYRRALSVVLSLPRSLLISPAHKQHHSDYVDQCVCSNTSKLLFMQPAWHIYLHLITVPWILIFRP